MKRRPQQRRGATLVLAALLIVLILALVAFSVDVGYIVLARTQLQAAADAAALAAAASTNLPRADMEVVAKQYAEANKVANRSVQLNSADIEYGTWDTASRRFTPSSTPSNAVRVTTRADRDNGGEVPLFFGRIFNLTTTSAKASAVATVNPRDIAFVVDLSGSMNDDSDPDNTDTINSTYAAAGYPNIGTQLMQQVYDDFGFGTFPGTTQCIGYPLGIRTSGGDPLTQLSSKTGPLSSSSIPSKYRILSSDSTSTRKRKAYYWTMDVQLASLMPAAKPTPSTSTTYSYWASYFDDHYKKLGYRSYTHFMMYYGRDEKPDGSTYTPLSLSNSLCPLHTEATAGGTFRFPPREQPTHASRRSIIAALQVIKERNQNISDVNQKDWVSIITFDKVGTAAITLALTDNYDSAMLACTRLQAVGSGGYSTDTEDGVAMAAGHIKPQNEGGRGRLATNKIVVLLTDGQPNLYSTSNSAIRNYRDDNPSSDFYGSSSKYAHDAALMQTSMIEGKRWSLYPVGIGADCDYDFMDRMARMGATANNDGQSARGSGNPADYETRLTEIFQNIITNPKLRLVQ
jgi:Flp pilus assembly protein TadG